MKYKDEKLLIYANLLFAICTGAYVVKELVIGNGLSLYFLFITIFAFSTALYAAIRYKKLYKSK